MVDAPHKRATLHDVARLADVSYQTVSRVVNGSPDVASHTRLRVLRAIRKLDYRPNRAARSLITGRTNVLQVITYDFYANGTFSSIYWSTKELGYNLGLSALNEHSTPEDVRDLMDELAARSVDGILILTPLVEPTASELRRLSRGIPFVQLGADPGPAVPSVLIDQRYGVQQVVKHLRELGHRRIAEISGPLGLHDGRARHEAGLIAAQAHGLEIVAFVEGNFSSASGYQATRQLLAEGCEFSALMCGNDQMALGARHALHEHGRRVPHDISLVGFDDDAFAAYLDPPLTTVRQDYGALGRQSVEYLVTLINEPQTPPHQRTLYPELVVRESARRVG